ncbi:MAG: hypothetical protein ACQEXB_18375 [Bacillota bacterium]
MATKQVTITVDPEKLMEFYRYAAKKGIKFSTWVQVKIDEFIEEEKMIEEFRRKHSD